MKLLFTNIGRRTYFIEFCIDLLSVYPDLEIYVSDCSEDTAGFWVDPQAKRFITPYVSVNPEHYVDELINICEKEEIDLLIPLMDYELLLLAGNKDKFERLGTTIVVSNEAFVDATLDKDKFYDFCQRNNILTPKTVTSLEQFNLDFPCILKKRLGSGSVGLKLIRTYEELESFESGTDILQEFITGVEYGIDILNDFSGNFCHTVIKQKLSMRAGETDKAVILFDELLYNYAIEVSKITRHIGNLDIDVLLTEDGKIYAIDFNPRFGGGYPFSHYAGYNFLDALIKFKKQIPVQFSLNKNLRIQAYKGIMVYGNNN